MKRTFAVPPRYRLSPRRAAALLIAFLCAASSCKKGDAGKETEFKYGRVFESGPVSFRVALSDTAITIAERLNMLLEIRTQKGWRAELPKFGEKLDQFGIVDYRNFQPELSEIPEIT